MTRPDLSAFVASAVMLLLLQGSSMAACDAQSFRKLTVTELTSAGRSVDPSLLPRGATHVVVDQSQAMLLRAPQPTRLMPVRYQIANPGGGTSPFFQCGIVFSRPDAPSHLVVTFGKDWTEAESCTGLRAIGEVASDDKGAPPRLALIYAGSSPSTEVTEPVLLSPAASGIYEPDAETSQWLAQSRQGHTIAGMRLLLARRARTRLPVP